MSIYPPATPPPPHQRDRTGLWAALVFLLLTVACLAAVAIAFSGGRLPDLGGAEVSWTPPPDQPTTPASASPSVSGQRFAVGDTVQNVNPGPVNLRQSPGFQNKPAADIIATVPAEQVVVIAGGPVEADGLVWWQVRLGDERTGWMAERSSSGVTLLDRAR